MRKVSGASRLSSTWFFHLSLRCAKAASSSACPNSAGPAAASIDSNSKLLNNRTPPPSRQIEINHHPARQSAGQQSDSQASFVQQHLSCAEQDSINQYQPRQ